MDIQKAALFQVQINQMEKEDMDGIVHKKSLSCLSVVESLTGSYRVTVGGDGPHTTGRGGFFIAPPQKEQIITHCADRDSGLFAARWLFVNVTVNDACPLESLYDFPVICPDGHRDELHRIMDGLFTAASPMERYAQAMAAVSLLTEIGTPKPMPAEEMLAVQQYLQSHYGEAVSVERLTRLVAVSPAKLYREFKRVFGISPIAYLNRYRLGQACLLLEESGRRIDEIAYAVGFTDALYFSRLFKKEYGVSPRQYRLRNS